MKRLFLVLVTAVMILPWLAAARVQADLIEWSASVSLVGPYVQENGTTQIIPSLQMPSAGLDINAFSGPLDGTNSAEDFPLASVLAFDSSDNGITKTFGGALANYSLSLSLHDLASGASGSLTFSGQFGGSFGAFAPINVTNTFLAPATQTLTLGKNVYTVTINGFYPPSEIVSNLGFGGETGTISTTISVQPAVNSTPEPSSLLLACLGLPSLGLAGWFRRRKAGKVGRILETHAASSA